MTTTLTTNFSLPIPPLGAGGTTDGYGTLLQTADTAIKNASGKGAWTDYSASSTIHGWSSFTEKHIKYKQVGSLLFVTFELTGDSNAITADFSLPNANAGGVTAVTLIKAVDNGGTAVASYCSLSPADNVVGAVPVMAGGSWTPSGTKSIVGQFFYEVA